MTNLSSLVDLKNGTISREIFVNDEIFKQELGQIFSRAWLFIGHEDLVPNPDDYFVSRMGTDSVILTRDRQNKINVLLNSCMHRGMKVCRYDQGNTRAFTCPYHGWSYSTDGRLVEVPGERLPEPVEVAGQVDYDAVPDLADLVDAVGELVTPVLDMHRGFRMRHIGAVHIGNSRHV